MERYYHEYGVDPEFGKWRSTLKGGNFAIIKFEKGIVITESCDVIKRKRVNDMAMSEIQLLIDNYCKGDLNGI